MSKFVTLQHTIRRWLTTIRRYDVELEESHAIALSGAGLRTYFFEPEDNYNWTTVHPDITWMPETLRADNYGAFEALRVHTGHSFRTWDSGTPVERLAVVKRELGEGRVLLHTAPDGTEGVISELKNDRLVMSLILEDGEGTREHHLGDLRHPDIVAANLGVFVTIAPEPDDSKARRRHALKADLLDWFPRHARAQKEIAYRDDVYFATGARGLIAFATRYTEKTWDDLDSDEATWVRLFSAELAEGRGAMAQSVHDGVFDEVLTSDDADALRASVKVWDCAAHLSNSSAELSDLADAARALAEADLSVAAALDAMTPLSWEAATSQSPERAT